MQKKTYACSVEEFLPSLIKQLDALAKSRELSAFSREAGIPAVWLNKIRHGLIPNPGIQSLIKLNTALTDWHTATRSTRAHDTRENAAL